MRRKPSKSIAQKNLSRGVWFIQSPRTDFFIFEAGSYISIFRQISQALPVFRRYIPSLSILSAAHPGWMHWWKRCYAAARWHPDGSVPEAFQKLLLLKADYPDTSPHRPDSRKRCDIPALLPSLNFPCCRCPVASL